MSSQKKDELDVFEMFYASVGPSLWDHLRQPSDEDTPVDLVGEIFEEDGLKSKPRPGSREFQAQTRETRQVESRRQNSSTGLNLEKHGERVKKTLSDTTQYIL